MIRLPSGHLVIDPGDEVDITVGLIRYGLKQARGADELTLNPGAERVAQAWLKAGTLNAPADVGKPVAADLSESGWVTVTEAAGLAGRSSRTVRDWASSGRLPSARFSGRQYVVKLEEVLQEAADG